MFATRLIQLGQYIASYLLTEAGDHLLLESGDRIILTSDNQ